MEFVSCYQRHSLSVMEIYRVFFLRNNYKAWILACITYPVSIQVGGSHNYRHSHLINSNNLSLLPTLEN